MKRTFYNIAVDCAEHPAEGPAFRKKTALIFARETAASRKWTYADLSRAVRRMANGLQRRGLESGDRILLKLPNGPEFPAAFFGAIRMGAIPIPISPLLTPSETVFLLKDSGARLILSKPEQVRALMNGDPADFGPPETRPDDPAYWLYTSGTEGRPKGVIHAHRSIPAHDARNRYWLDLRKTDVVFNTSALNWSYALTSGLADTLRAGATSVIFSGRLEPPSILKVIAAHRVTVFMSVPGIYRRLVEYLESRPKARRLFASVRVCLSAGEKLSAEVQSRLRNMTGVTIREGLGMTEHSVYLVQPKGRRVVEGSCGRALPGHRVAILRADLKPARPGEVGILASHRSCPGLMIGYHRRLGEQRSLFRKAWFLSGDLATRDRRGNFFYVGRRDDVITAGGYRISPMEVEAVLNHHPAVRESAVVGREIVAGKTIVCAYVVLKRGRKATDRLKRHILETAANKLARYKAPREVVVVRELPKTSTGKLLRRRFRSL